MINKIEKLIIDLEQLTSNWPSQFMLKYYLYIELSLVE